MIDYQGLYEDLLSMQRHALDANRIDFADLCREFRMDLLLRFHNPVGYFTNY
jgi:hypothetical protein